MKKMILSLGSTALSGFSNIFVQLVAAAVLGEGEFAQFSILAATIILFTGLARSIVGQTDMLRGRNGIDHGPIDASLAMALLVLLLGIAALTLGAIADNEPVRVVGVSGLLASGFVLQDSARFRAFRSGMPGAALMSDTIVVLSIGIVFVVAGPLMHSTEALALVWTGATVLGFLGTVILLRSFPVNPVAGARWVWKQKDLVLPSAAEFVLQSALPYALNFLVLAVGGPAALGGYRLIQLFFSVLGNIASGINAAVVPRLVESRSPQTAIRLSKVQFSVLSLLSLCIFFGALLIPHGFGESLFGNTWISMVPFLVVGSLHGWINAVAVPNYTLLRLLGYANYSLFVRIFSVFLSLFAAAVAALLGSAVGIAWAIAVPAILAYFARALVTSRSLRGLIQKKKKIPLR